MPIDREKLKMLMMPRDSALYDHCSEAERFFLLARAYQDCSLYLFGEMIEERIDSSFHHAKVAVSLFEQAVELFLKAGIGQAGQPIPTHHELDQLHGQFRNLYPGKRFEFTASVADFVRPSDRAPHNQFARYPTDPAGKVWEDRGHSFIDLARFFEQTTLFLEDLNRLWPLMKDRYPKT